jgi:hypothetical protein
MIQVQLASLDQLEVQIEEIEDRIAAALKPSSEVRLLRTIPGGMSAGDWISGPGGWRLQGMLAGPQTQQSRPRRDGFATLGSGG